MTSPATFDINHDIGSFSSCSSVSGDDDPAALPLSELYPRIESLIDSSDHISKAIAAQMDDSLLGLRLWSMLSHLILLTRHVTKRQHLFGTISRVSYQ
ncbi:hypothetical protein ACJ73_03394 [Blastomyces percursus]|uniref:Uncharacterized protein n=1 Tax=Blastomyces percursus TaxID=1658174 RepID=A0A1J9RB82_9EURO|nr:hypothetical protein ACJ73_03394 [Blastomyces percursus]